MGDDIGQLAQDGVPYKIVAATKDKPTFASGAKGTYDALILSFEILRGDRKGERFNKNYTFFQNDDGTLTGPGARYLKDAAKILGVPRITKASELVGHSFVHKVVEKPNKNGGDPFLEFYPVAQYGTPPATTVPATADNQNKLTLTNSASAPPMVRRRPPVN